MRLRSFRQMNPPALERRPFCDRCLRPKVACFCAELKPFDPGFDLVILQHPKERRKSTASARMAHLAISTSTLVQGVDCDAHPEVRARLEDPSRLCVVLYPGREAVALDSPEGLGRLRKVVGGLRLTVFVIDGTWSTARTLLAKSPAVAALQCVAFTPSRPSEYGFKKQPSRYCLSTVEAVIELVRTLAPGVDTGQMARAFREMVERQLAYTEERKD